MLIDFLRTVPLFGDLEEGQLQRLAAVAREEKLAAYQLIFREGDAVDAFFLVREGLVTLFRDAVGDPQQVLARLEPGGYFGELGLLNDKSRRIASARTAAPTRLLRIDKTDLTSLLADNPTLELRFRAEIIRRHGLNVSALLGLAGQRDVRIRLGLPAILELEDGTTLDVVLENLSIGGIGFSKVPESWQVGQLVRFTLGRSGEPGILQASGAITWREGDTVGIAFGPEASGNANLVHRTLRRFLDGRR